MRILHLDTRPDWRGGQQQILLLMRGLRDRGHTAELLTAECSPLAQRARNEGFTAYAAARRLVRAGMALRLKALLRDGGYSIVHAHDPHALTAAWLAGAHHKAAMVAARRVAYPLGSSKIGLARYLAAHRILAISEYVAQSVRAAGIGAPRLAIVYDGVDACWLCPAAERDEARRRWGFDEQEKILGCVGYLLPEKGQETLVRAMALVAARFPKARLLLAGDGPCRAGLEKLARELGVAERVVFAGFVREIADAYHAMDVFLFPSLAEPLGTSLLAAMSHGLPAIAVASGGVPEVIADGHNGILVAEPSPALFAGAIERLLQNPEFAGELAAAGRTTIHERFTAAKMVEGTLAAYEEAARMAPARD